MLVRERPDQLKRDHFKNRVFRRRLRGFFFSTQMRFPLMKYIFIGRFRVYVWHSFIFRRRWISELGWKKHCFNASYGVSAGTKDLGPLSRFRRNSTQRPLVEKRWISTTLANFQRKQRYCFFLEINSVQAVEIRNLHFHVWKQTWGNMFSDTFQTFKIVPNRQLHLLRCVRSHLMQNCSKL